jgi:hypothetical protein
MCGAIHSGLIAFRVIFLESEIEPSKKTPARCRRYRNPGQAHLKVAATQAKATAKNES